MGTTTDAILFYGLLIEEESKAALVLAEEYDEEDGATNHPLVEMNYTGNAEGGVVLVYHCSNDFTMYAVAAEVSVLKAHRGHPKVLTHMHSRVIDPEDGWDVKLKGFCEKHGVQWKQPSWHLASYWG